MAVPAFLRLQKILDLEEKQGWRNRGVIGGIRAMSTRWAEDAHRENNEPRLVEATVALMLQYDAATGEQRAQLAGHMRLALAGNLEALGELPIVQATPQPSAQSRPAHATDKPTSPAKPSIADSAPAPNRPEKNRQKPAKAASLTNEPQGESLPAGSSLEAAMVDASQLEAIIPDTLAPSTLAPDTSIATVEGQPVAESGSADPHIAEQAAVEQAGTETRQPEHDANQEANVKGRTAKQKEQKETIIKAKEPAAKEQPPKPQPAKKAAKATPAPSTSQPNAGVGKAAFSDNSAERDLLTLPDEEVEFSGNSYVYVDESFVPQPETPTFKPRAQRRAQRPNRNPRDLQSPVTTLVGVGPSVAEQLARIEINNVIDIVWHLPTRHEDYSHMRTIAQLQPGEQATIIANLWEVKERKIGINRIMLQGILGDGTGTIHATWWNRFVKNQLTTGSMMRFSGKVGLYLGQKTLDNPAFEDADAEMVATGRLAPIYPLTEGLTHKRIRNLVLQVLDDYGHFIADPLPRNLCERHHLPDLQSALWQIHFPETPQELEEARQRLSFEEFLYIQLGVLQRRRELQQTLSQSMQTDEASLQKFAAAMPFPLTGAQQRVIREIATDLARTIPMTRLIQGDVGSGKTAVAASAMWIAVQNGAQAALLAPTQILAEQHHRGINKLLNTLVRPDGTTPINIALLTGRVTGNERQRILDGLREGSIDIVIGTTALTQEGVEFANLGLVVVDEQHRFGVEQRSVLRSKGATQPHLLVMSATPIPRSLALTIYGDLDLSIIDEMPPGRIPIQTKLFRPSDRERLYTFMRKEASEGRQSFIIYPLVEESDTLDVGAAVEAHARLSKEILPDLRVALLHGRMSGSDKDEIMQAFANRDYDVLVSTSVIEVGIDIPNASLIVIEDAERFGLAQLHQFRGRVGRGQHKSYCALVSNSDRSGAEERLRALEATNDGFKLAEKDLELRGPGDFLGTRQSGLPELRIAHLSDIATLTLAREAAQKLFAEDPTLTHYPALAKQVSRFWRGHGEVN